jgi:predicted nucleotidyltransferase
MAESPSRAVDRRNPVSNERPDIPKDLIEDFCRRHHIRKLSVFGSYLREDFGPESDIDFLVEFDPEHIPGLIEFAGMEIELSELLRGQKVDLRTPQELSRYFRDEVLAEAEIQYAEG